jgi:hypothetical protein
MRLRVLPPRKSGTARAAAGPPPPKELLKAFPPPGFLGFDPCAGLLGWAGATNGEGHLI